MEWMTQIVLVGIVAIALSWWIGERWSMWVMSLATALWLLIIQPLALGILILTSLTSYGALRWIPRRTAATLVVVVQAIALFTFFKMGHGYEAGLSTDRLIPIGLSYFSFRQIHVALEHLKGKLPPHTWGTYLHYMFFLPTLLVGPINRFPTFQRDFQRRRWDSNLASYGLERILYGYFKVYFLGNFLLSSLLYRYARYQQEEHLWLGTYLEAVQYFLNSYFQFAGFSDIAIGLAALAGYRVMENFHFPFLAHNVNDFWNRWHISLSAFAKDYLYMPFMSLTRLPFLAIVFTMLAIGLWHEFSWRYILWGFLHGLGVAAAYFFQKSWAGRRFDELKPIWRRPLSVFLTFHFVVLTFSVIMRDSLAEGWEAMRILLGLN